MKSFSIFTLLSEKLVGKQLKHITHFERLEQEINISVKRPTATEKQFEGGNPRFRMNIASSKHLGFRTIYDYSEVVKVEFEQGHYDESDSILITLANGKEIDMSLSSELIEVDKDVFYLDY